MRNESKKKTIRNESEKKTKSTSFRLSENQRAEIQKLADERGMTLSNFIATAAMNAKNQFSPEQCVHVQNIINIATELALKYDKDKLPEIDEEERAVWFM